jgi:hypothetical protein
MTARLRRLFKFIMCLDLKGQKAHRDYMWVSGARAQRENPAFPLEFPLPGSPA